MSNSKLKKTAQLGVNISTASGVLRKQIMFHLAQKCGLDTCFKCGKKIADVDDFTIEHKIPWLDSEDPVKLFFDMDNIAFSHHACNVGTARRPGITGRKSEEYEKNNVSSCGYKGVYLESRRKKPYHAKGSVNGGSKSFGYYLTAEEAARAYDEAIVIYQGEHAMTNKRLGLL